MQSQMRNHLHARYAYQQSRDFTLQSTNQQLKRRSLITSHFRNSELYSMPNTCQWDIPRNSLYAHGKKFGSYAAHGQNRPHRSDGSNKKIFSYFLQCRRVSTFTTMTGEFSGFKNNAIWEAIIKSRLHPRRKQKDKMETFRVLTPSSFTHLEEDSHRDGYGNKGKSSDTLLEAITAYENCYFELAKYYYEQAAMNGELIAIHNLGVMFLHGQGIPKDQRRAYECFIMCSSCGISESMAQLGYIYMHGKGVSQNFVKARQWFERSIESGNVPFSQYNMAVIYLNGLGVTSDFDKGVAWLAKSVKNRFLPAMFNLAVMYAAEEETAELARLIYKRTALEMDDPISQNNLGIMYATGAGGAQYDLKIAAQLFRLASYNGVPEAVHNLSEIQHAICSNN